MTRLSSPEIPKRIEKHPFAMKLRERLKEICIEDREVLKSFDKNALTRNSDTEDGENRDIKSAFYKALTDASFAGFSLDVDSFEIGHDSMDWFEGALEPLGFQNYCENIKKAKDTKGMEGYDLATAMNPEFASLDIAWWILPAGDDREYFYVFLRLSAVLLHLDDEGLMADTEVYFLNPKEY